MTSTTNDRWMNEFKDLAQLRDEVRLKAHLLGSELRDQWHELEARWEEFERGTRPARWALSSSAKEIGTSARQLLESLTHGYRRIHDTVARHSA